MGRPRRLWNKDDFYHIVCRGNRRDPLFQDRDDFAVFLYILFQVYEKIPFELASYCLMTNHYHFQLRSPKEPLWKVMALINKRYADYFNKKYSLTGHVFEKRYFSKGIMPGKGMIDVSCYIHLNPVEAGMVEKPEDYPWSSYVYYKTKVNCPYVYFTKDVIIDEFSGSFVKKSERYCEEVMSKIDQEFEVETGCWRELEGACTV